MVRVRQVAGLLVVAAYAAVLLVPCGSMARPLSETRITHYCECPGHAAHGSGSAVPLDLARLPHGLADVVLSPLFTPCAGWEPGFPVEPIIDLSPPVPIFSR